MKLRRALFGIGVLAVVVVAGVASVRLDWWEPLPVLDERPFTFSEDFESVSKFADLFPMNGTRWHGSQRVPDENVVDVTTEAAHSGRQSLKCRAVASRSGVTSKADLELGGLHFVKGDHVWSQCWMLLKVASSAENVFLWDLESSHKWQSPGRRLYLQTGDVLASDLGKWAFSPTFRQPWSGRVRFPRDRWVRLRVHLFLMNNAHGRMEVWQDDTKVLDAYGQTLPTAKAVYDRLQIGLTANGGTSHEHTIYVDDLVISNRAISL